MAKNVSPDLFERDTPIRSTLVGGISRSSFDLCGPGLLNVLLTVLQAGEQLDGQAGSLIRGESQGFLKYFLRGFFHDRIVSGQPQLTHGPSGLRPAGEGL